MGKLLQFLDGAMILLISMAGVATSIKALFY